MASAFLRSVSPALVAALALAGAAPRPALAQGVVTARVQTRTPCTGASPMREALRAPVRGDEEATRRLLELRASRIAAGAAGGAGGAAVGAGRGGIVQFHSQLASRGYLGLRMLEVSDMRETASGRVVRYCQYPVVLSVVPESPADRAGLLEGDTLVAYNDLDLVKSGEIELDRILVPGETVRVSLRRDGRPQVRPLVVGRQQLNIVRMLSRDDRGEMVVVGAAPGAPGAPGAEVRPSTGRVVLSPRARATAPTGDVVISATTPVAPSPPAFIYFGGMGGGPTPLAGAQLLTLDDDLREALGARAGAGIVVVRVIPGSPAAQFGLRSGDVIRSAGGNVVSSPQEFQRALATARAATASDERVVQIEVERRGQRKTIALKW